MMTQADAELFRAWADEDRYPIDWGDAWIDALDMLTEAMALLETVDYGGHDTAWHDRRNALAAKWNGGEDGSS